MHELSIVQSVMDRVQAEARARGATQVHRLELRVGSMSGVVPELLHTAWEVFRQGTLCDQAELHIVEVPAIWGCPACARDLEAGAALRCPHCGGPARLRQGDELMLDRLEMEVPDV